MGEDRYVTVRNIQRQPLWAGGGPKLRHLDIELTERCNNACLHCYINRAEDDARARQQELSTAEWQDVLRQAAGLGALGVRLTGGEPLLRPDFAELYVFARRLGLKVQIFTNARRITAELAELFGRIPPREKIEISAYGMHPESYAAAASAPGGYAEFRGGVERLLERGVPFTVKYALLPQNKADLEEFEAWAARLPGMDQAPSIAMFFELRGRRDSPARNRLIRQLRVPPAEGLEILERRAPGYIAELAEFCGRGMGASGARLFACGAGLGGSVDAYGRYQPCLLLRDPALAYDLRRGSLQDGLENFFPQVRQIQARNPDYLARCGRCFLHGLCEQCPAKSWAEHGTLDTPVEYVCQVAHAQARRLGLLAEGERAWEVTDGPERVKQMKAKEG